MGSSTGHAPFAGRRVVLLTLLLIAGGARAADWPQFRGPAGSGTSPETGINKDWTHHPPRLLWKVALGDDGFAGPSVAGGRVFIIDHQGSRDVVRALDLKSGKELWRFAYPDTDKRLYGFARATPAVSAGRVYTLSRLGMAFCLDARTGKKLWGRDIIKAFAGRRPQWDLAASPLVDGNRVILCPGGPNAAVVALDSRTGKTLWKGGGSDQPGYATPVAATIGGVKQYVVFASSSLLGADAATGRLLWSIPWETPLEPGLDTPSARAHFNANAATPLVLGDSIFITTDYGHGCALVDVAGGKARIRWHTREMQAHYSSPVAAGGCVYGNSNPDHLVCVDLRTGRAAWKQRGFSKGGLIAVDGALIAVDMLRGNVVLAEMTPAGYRELGRVRPLGGESRTAPVVAERKLLIRNRKALACLDLTPAH